MTMVLPIAGAPILAAGMLLALALWIAGRKTRVRTGILIGILAVGTLATGIPGAFVAILCIDYVTSRYAYVAIPFLIGFLVYMAVMVLAFIALRKRTRPGPGAAMPKKPGADEPAHNNLDPPAEGRADAPPAQVPCNAGPREVQRRPTPPRQVPVWVSLLVFLGMLTGAMALITTDPTALAYAWLFPYGLCAILSMLLGSPQSEVLGVSLLVVSFAIYIVMLVSFIRTRTWIKFAVRCLVLLCLLLLNVAGCRMIAGGISRIGN